MAKTIVGFKVVERVRALSHLLVGADMSRGYHCEVCGSRFGASLVDDQDESYDLCLQCFTCHRLEPVFEGE